MDVLGLHVFNVIAHLIIIAFLVLVELLNVDVLRVELLQQQHVLVQVGALMVQVASAVIKIV